MNLQSDSPTSTLPHSLVHALDEPSTETPVPIEVRMGIPAWIMRDPGPVVDIEDDQCDWQEG